MSEIEANMGRLESGNLFSERETEAFRVILATSAAFSPPVIARVAGGWVRDKLLGKESDDIDIAVENCTGVAFAERLRDAFLSQISKLVVIEANPDQSKHLETARVCLHSDIWIDFCGLRSESYTAESRIPQVQFGTPTEDAHRRDFTVNTLFFNLNTQKVEDFTGGLPDLKEGILRTPLPPVQTFTDDPLRILRAFRFVSKFGFSLHESIIPAAKSVVGDFRRKITRERINTELTKALEARNPMSLMHNLALSELFLAVFDPDGSLALNESEAIERVQKLLSREVTDRLVVLVLAAIYAPFSGDSMRDPERGNKLVPILEVVILRTLRFPSKFAEEAIQILSAVEWLKQLEKPFTRLKIGRWVRNVGQLWPYVHFLVFDDQLYQLCVDEIYPLIHQLDLVNAWELKPLLNGLELASAHGLRPGRGYKDLIERLLIDWQLEHPLGTAEDYLAHVRAQAEKPHE